MSLAEMQACLARLYVDEPFRKLFLIEPSTLYEYRLTAEETEAIQGIDHRSLEFFARSLKNKRRGRIARAYPALQKLDAAEFERYYSRYYQLYIAKPNQSVCEEVLTFGTFYEESVAGADHMPPYAADLARYERLYYRIRFAPRFTRRAADPATTLAARRIEDDSAVPYMRDGVELGDFSYDVYEIEERLSADEKAPALETLTGGPCSIAFRPSTNTSAAKILRLNGATRAVLGRCDGHATVGSIVADIAAEVAGEGTRAGIISVLNRLLAYEVLTLDPAMASVPEPARAYGTSHTEGM